MNPLTYTEAITREIKEIRARIIWLKEKCNHIEKLNIELEKEIQKQQKGGWIENIIG